MYFLCSLLSPTNLTPHVCASDRVRLVVGVHLLAVESNRCCRLHKLLPGADRGASDYIK